LGITLARCRIGYGLQNDSAYECFYFIADWHALTSDYADTSGVAENTLQIMIDYLAAGLDRRRA